MSGWLPGLSINELSSTESQSGIKILIKVGSGDFFLKIRFPKSIVFLRAIVAQACVPSRFSDTRFAYMARLIRPSKTQGVSHYRVGNHPSKAQCLQLIPRGIYVARRRTTASKLFAMAILDVRHLSSPCFNRNLVRLNEARTTALSVYRKRL